MSSEAIPHSFASTDLESPVVSGLEYSPKVFFHLQKPSEPLSQNAAVSEVQGPGELSGSNKAEPSVALNRHEGPTGPARSISQVETIDVGRDELTDKIQGAQDGQSKQLPQLQTIKADFVDNSLAPQSLLAQDAPEEGDGDQAREEGFDEEKENNPPSRTRANSPSQEAGEDATGGASPSKAHQEQDRPSGAPFLLPDDTLVGSLLAAQGGEEKRVSSGQAAHRGCYKSRPFSARGVERRALAAVKKGMGQRDALLAERRSKFVCFCMLLWEHALFLLMSACKAFRRAEDKRLSAGERWCALTGGRSQL